MPHNARTRAGKPRRRRRQHAARPGCNAHHSLTTTRPIGAGFRRPHFAGPAEQSAARRRAPVTCESYVIFRSPDRSARSHWPAKSLTRPCPGCRRRPHSSPRGSSAGATPSTPSSAGRSGRVRRVFQKLTHNKPLESDQIRRGPTPGFGGATTLASPLTASILAMWSPASDAYQISPFGVVVMPYGPTPFGAPMHRPCRSPDRHGRTCRFGR